MSKISDRVSYLQGLAEGMEIDGESKTGRLLKAMIDVLGDVASELQHLEDEHNDLDEYVGTIDDDLAEVEEVLFDDDENDDEEDGCDDEDDDLIECECPHCGNTIYFDAEAFDLADDHNCPECGKPLFDEDDGDDKGDDE